MDSSKLTEAEKEDFARDKWNHLLTTRQSAENRHNDAEDEFSKLLVQISAILFALTGFFLEKLHVLGSFVLDVIFVVGSLSLLVSLVLGLFKLKRDSMFWFQWMDLRNKLYVSWEEVIKKDRTFEEANIYYKALTGDGPRVLSSPDWPWILQSVTLGIGAGIMLFVFIAYLFS